MVYPQNKTSSGNWRAKHPQVNTINIQKHSMCES